jgi:hypothetical protein
VKRPGAIVGVLAFAVLVYIALNTLRTEGPGSRGVPGGTQMPAFAVPLAASDLDGDANVSDRACSVRGGDILNVCQLYEQGDVVLAFFIQSSERCDEQLDTVDRVRERFSDKRFAAVAIKGDRDDLRSTVREHGWELPVGYDRDGAVANAYGVAVCPTIVLARKGGEVARTLLGSQDAQQLEATIRKELG